MRVVDDVEWLKDNLDRIEKSDLNVQPVYIEREIINVANSARGLIEAIEKVKFNCYGHRLRTNVRAIRVVNNPDHPEIAEIVYERDRNISLRQFCGAIFHLRNFTFNFRQDGKHWLDVINDRSERHQAFYSDFISALRTLVLSKRLAVLALCDLSDMESRMNRDPLSISSLSFGWLLHQHLPKEDQLKLSILADIFGIKDVPAETLSELKFSIVSRDTDYQETIEFGPHWETGQRVVSPEFSRRDLFKSVREFYREPYDSRRVHNN